MNLLKSATLISNLKWVTSIWTLVENKYDIANFAFAVLWLFFIGQHLQYTYNQMYYTSSQIRKGQISLFYIVKALGSISNTISETAQEFKWKIKYFHPYLIFLRASVTVTDESAWLSSQRPAVMVQWLQPSTPEKIFTRLYLHSMSVYEKTRRCVLMWERVYL